MTELVIVALLALLLLGADQLPQAARTVGKGLREFRRATEDLKDQIETEIYSDEQKRRQSTIQPVPSAQRPPLSTPTPEGAPAYLPGLEPSAAPATPAEPEAESAPAPPEDGAPPRS
jgi:sec-independent protein translocase protein TatB